MNRKILIGGLAVAAVLLGLYFFNQQKPSIPTPTPTPMAIPQAAANNDTEIKTVLEKEVPNKSGVQKFEVVELNVKGDFAKATIKPLDVETDNAFVILQKKDGTWQIIYGPGTDLSPENPIYKTLPEGLLGF